MYWLFGIGGTLHKRLKLGITKSCAADAPAELFNSLTSNYLCYSVRLSWGITWRSIYE